MTWSLWSSRPKYLLHLSDTSRAPTSVSFINKKIQLTPTTTNPKIRLMASSPLLNLLSFSTTLSKPPPPPPPPPQHKSPLLHLSLSTSFTPLRNRNRNELGCKPLLAKREGFQVEVGDDEDEEEDDDGYWMIDEFRREVMRTGLIQECLRRRFHENKHEAKKRKNREAARRNRRRRGPYRDPALDELEANRIREEDDADNNEGWDYEGDIPY